MELAYQCEVSQSNPRIQAYLISISPLRAITLSHWLQRKPQVRKEWPVHKTLVRNKGRRKWQVAVSGYMAWLQSKGQYERAGTNAVRGETDA